MFKYIFYNKLKKENWEWSWNGGVPYYLIEVLFLEPVKRYLCNLKHLKKYSLIASDYGKNISAYIVTQNDLKEKCDIYFKKNIKQYIQDYKILIKKTNDILFSYNESFRTNTIQKINYQELKFLSELLIKNSNLYLISQPETTFVLGDSLSNDLNKQNISQKQKNEIFELLQPPETILNVKDRDFKNLIKKIKNKKNKKKFEKEIFDFYWKYRSFFMIDLNGNLEEELNILKDSIKKQNKYKIKTTKKRKIINYKLSEKSENIIRYIQEMGALRFEGKNTWVNLTLLLINLLQKFSKQVDIPMEVLEKYSFGEIESLLKIGKRVENFEKRKTSIFIISHTKINSYHGEDALKIERIIKGNIEKTDSVKGNVAYSGNIKGTAFIITAQDNLLKKIKEISKIKDPILIAEQTIPSYLPLIKKAKGIITNEGGILSHAAIVSREYKVPALIGTKIATQIFKQGEKITIDTEKEIAFKDKTSKQKRFMKK